MQISVALTHQNHVTRKSNWQFCITRRSKQTSLVCKWFLTQCWKYLLTYLLVLPSASILFQSSPGPCPSGRPQSNFRGTRSSSIRCTWPSHLSLLIYILYTSLYLARYNVGRAHDCYIIYQFYYNIINSDHKACVVIFLCHVYWTICNNRSCHWCIDFIFNVAV